MESDDYDNKHEEKKYNDSIQQPTDKIKSNYGDCVETSSYLAKKRYNNNIIYFLEHFFPYAKRNSNQCSE